MLRSLPIAPRPELKPPPGVDDHWTGSIGPAVELVMFGDYQCPHCKAVDMVLRELRHRLAVPLRIYWRHFPLAKVHPHSRDAALVAEAGARSGLFWPLHHLLFDRSPDLSREKLLEYAAQTGVDPNQMSNCFSDPLLAARVRDHIKSGVRSGVNKTPTLYFQGLRYNGGNNAAALEDAIVAAAVLATDSSEAAGAQQNMDAVDPPVNGGGLS